MNNKHDRGFTLIELLMVIIITGILFRVVSLFIVSPFQAYTDISIRGELIDIADMALRRIERDIRDSVPNSVRVKVDGQTTAIEMLHIIEGIRYRSQGPGPTGTPNDSLDFTKPISDFGVILPFQVASLGATSYRAVIYNTGAYGATTDNPLAGANVYSSNNATGPVPPTNSHIITPANTTITLSTIGSEGHVHLSAPFQFAFPSPQQRVFLVDTPISYVCDASNTQQNITRYWNYTIAPTQPLGTGTFPFPVTTKQALLSNHIMACTFEYVPGTPYRNAIVNLHFTLQKGKTTVQLLRQVSVPNVP